MAPEGAGLLRCSGPDPSLGLEDPGLAGLEDFDPMVAAAADAAAEFAADWADDPPALDAAG